MKRSRVVTGVDVYHFNVKPMMFKAILTFEVIPIRLIKTTPETRIVKYSNTANTEAMESGLC